MSRCTCCKQPVDTTPVRRCADCGQRMGLHDKWTIVERNGVQTWAHRYCDNPTGYVAAAS